MLFKSQKKPLNFLIWLHRLLKFKHISQIFLKWLVFLIKSFPPHYSKLKNKQTPPLQSQMASEIQQQFWQNPGAALPKLCNFSCLPWISQITIILETHINNSEEQNTCLLSQRLKFCGKFPPFLLQPVLINVWNVAFPFCASSKEAPVCFENCGYRVSAGFSPWSAMTSVVERMRLQHNSQLKKGRGQGRGGKGDTEKFKIVSCLSLFFPTALADKEIQGGFSLRSISCLP